MKVFVESVLEKQKKDGSGSFFVCAMDIEGTTKEVTVYDARIKDYKQKELELDLKKGKFGLIGNFPDSGGQKKQWQPQDPDGMYRCNASDKATQLLIAILNREPAPTLETWDKFYDHIYAKMAGKPIPEWKEDVPDFKPVQDYPEFTKQEAKVNTDTTSQGSITPEQLSAITGGFARLKIKDHKGKVKTIIGTAKMPEYLTKAEGKLVILQINKELDATGL